MNRRRKPITAAELTAKLNADPEFIARKQRQNALRSEFTERLREEEEPVLLDLSEVGCEITSVWDLVNTSRPYPHAIPVLLKHLERSYSQRLKEGIARALAVPDAHWAWKELVSMYRKEPLFTENGANNDAKDGLAVAISAIAADSDMDEVVRLLEDKSLGKTRVLLLGALKRSKIQSKRAILQKLAKDDDLAGEISSWKHAL